jgi:hypothetical protein
VTPSDDWDRVRSLGTVERRVRARRAEHKLAGQGGWRRDVDVGRIEFNAGLSRWPGWTSPQALSASTNSNTSSTAVGLLRSSALLATATPRLRNRAPPNGPTDPQSTNRHPPPTHRHPRTPPSRRRPGPSSPRPRPGRHPTPHSRPRPTIQPGRPDTSTSTSCTNTPCSSATHRPSVANHQSLSGGFRRTQPLTGTDAPMRATNYHRRLQTRRHTPMQRIVCSTGSTLAPDSHHSRHRPAGDGCEQILARMLSSRGTGWTGP